jgi:hypothetical protein
MLNAHRKGICSILITSLLVLSMSLAPRLLMASGSSLGASNCDDTRTPVVFVHGFLASGDTWSTQIQRFASNGLCKERFFAFDWNSLSAGNADMLLDLFIDSVRAVTDADQVHLVGHSAGGGRGYAYLSDPLRAEKVKSYVHIGSNPQNGPAGPGGAVPTLNIYSTGDKIVTGNDIPGAANVQFQDLDHYQVATSAATFAEMYSFFYGETPMTTSIVATSTILISGKCLTLGENRPTSGASIEVFAVDATGDAIEPALATFAVGSNGFWGPLEVQPEQHYLFKVSAGSPGFRRVIYYYQPFVRDNDMVYLRTFPPPLSLAGILLSAIPNNDNLSVVSIFTSTQAVLHGRDQLSLDGIDLATPALASESASMIALFCYDNGADGQGNGEPIANYLAFPFLQGADLPLVPQPEQTYLLQFNGSSMPVRNWRSQSDGVVIAVFNDPDEISSIRPGDGGYQPSDLRFYPNPTSGDLYVASDRIPMDINSLTLTGINGQSYPLRAQAVDAQRLRIDTGHLRQGIYVLTLHTPQGRMSGAFQVVNRAW